MRSVILLLLFAAWRVHAASCNATQIASQIVPLDTMVRHQYRYGGVADALGFYATLCAQNDTLPFLPSVPACDFMNDGICAAALGGDESAIIQVLDALRTYKNPVVSGSNGCIDPWTMPVADPLLNMISCPCVPGKECVDFTISSGGTVSIASTDDNTVLFTVVMALALAMVLVFAIATIIFAGMVVSRVEWAAPSPDAESSGPVRGLVQTAFKRRVAIQ